MSSSYTMHAHSLEGGTHEAKAEFDTAGDRTAWFAIELAPKVGGGGEEATLFVSALATADVDDFIDALNGALRGLWEWNAERKVAAARKVQEDAA